MIYVLHYNDIIMGAMTSQITSLTIVYSTVYSDADKKNIKVPRHWPLCGEFTSDRWIPRTNGQYRGKCFHLMTSSWVVRFPLFCFGYLWYTFQDCFIFDSSTSPLWGESTGDRWFPSHGASDAGLWCFRLLKRNVGQTINRVAGNCTD